jgi:hypothetical protein
VDAAISIDSALHALDMTKALCVPQSATAGTTEFRADMDEYLKTLTKAVLRNRSELPTLYPTRQNPPGVRQLSRTYLPVVAAVRLGQYDEPHEFF